MKYHKDIIDFSTTYFCLIIITVISTKYLSQHSYYILNNNVECHQFSNQFAATNCVHPSQNFLIKLKATLKAIACRSTVLMILSNHNHQLSTAYLFGITSPRLMRERIENCLYITNIHINVAYSRLYVYSMIS